MDKIEIKSSRLKYILAFIAVIGFVVCGAFLLSQPAPKWIGWMGILFFGPMIPLFAWQLFDSRPRLIIDNEGVLDRTLKIGKIAWCDISGVYLKEIKGNSFICLKLKDDDKYLTKLSPLMRAATSTNVKLGFTPLSLNLSGVNADAHQVFELVLKMSEANNS
jgi:hypothetical protein